MALRGDSGLHARKILPNLAAVNPQGTAINLLHLASGTASSRTGTAYWSSTNPSPSGASPKAGAAAGGSPAEATAACLAPTLPIPAARSFRPTNRHQKIARPPPASPRERANLACRHADIPTLQKKKSLGRRRSTSVPREATLTPPQSSDSGSTHQSLTPSPKPHLRGERRMTRPLRVAQREQLPPYRIDLCRQDPVQACRYVVLRLHDDKSGRERRRSKLQNRSLAGFPFGVT